MKAKTLLVAALFAVVPALAQAWDARGHILIDSVAAQKLRPEVAGKIEALLPLLDTRFNGGRAYTLATAGCWLDDMRGAGKQYPWSRWHYVDIPCEGCRAYSVPPPPHALWALDQATEVLRSQTAEPKARAEALAQVMHIVGDIHQPLHVADRGDKGGNGVPIARLTESEPGPSNLHAFWDAAYRYDARDGQIVEQRVTAEQLGGRITANLLLPSDQPWRQWASETHAIACKSGWPGAWLTGNKSGPVQLTPEFVHAAHEIALQQIALAGERLAALLNKLLGEDLKTDRSPIPPAQSVH